MRGRRLALVAAALATSAAAFPAASCSSATEAIVVVGGDAPDIDAVTVRIETKDGFVEEKSVRLADVPFPLTLGVASGEDDSREFTVTATAFREGRVVVSRVTRARLVGGQRSVLVVALCSSCAGVTCEGEATCAAGSCAPIVEERRLAAWEGAPPAVRCDDAPVDGGGRADASIEAGDADAAPRVVLPGGYHLIEDPRNWSAIDLERDVDAKLVGYSGAAFDGTFLYLSPWAKDGALHGNVARYDTTKPFGEKTSWTSFDATTVDLAAKGFAGAATFKNEFVYFVPYANGTGDVVARYRVGAPFEQAASWAKFDLDDAPATAAAAGLGGAVVNNSHVWMTARGASAPFVLHDNRITNDPMNAGWSAIDPKTVDAGVTVPGGYYGGAFALDHLMYFAPFRNAAGPHGVALMRDVNAPGTAADGWVAFDIAAAFGVNARGYVGAVFDGKYVTFVPFENGAGAHGFAARVDTGQPFGAKASWTVLDLTTIDADLKGFVGGVFDGRFVYFVPYTVGPSGLWLVRYDTTGAFGDVGAWSRFDLRGLPGTATARFHGAAFDGKYVYLVPYTHGPVLRFEARQTADKTAIKANGSFL